MSECHNKYSLSPTIIAALSAIVYATESTLGGSGAHLSTTCREFTFSETAELRGHNKGGARTLPRRARKLAPLRRDATFYTWSIVERLPLTLISGNPYLARCRSDTVGFPKRQELLGVVEETRC